MLISLVALLPCIVFNVLTFPSFTHAKPVPPSWQRVNTNPIIVQRNIETSSFSRLNSLSPPELLDQQLLPRANDDAHFTQVIKDAERIPSSRREGFFVKYMDEQWKSLHGKKHNANEDDIQFAVRQLVYLHELTTAKKFQSLIPPDMNLMTRPFVEAYILFIANQPSLPARVSPKDTRIVIEAIETHPEAASKLSVTSNLRLRKNGVEKQQCLKSDHDHNAELVIYVAWDLAYMRGLHGNVNDKITAYKEYCHDVLSKTIIDDSELTPTDISEHLEVVGLTHAVRSKVTFMVENCMMRWTIFKGIVEHGRMSKEECMEKAGNDFEFFRSLSTYTDSRMLRLRDVGVAYTELYQEKCSPLT